MVCLVIKQQGHMCFQDGGTRRLEKARVSLDDCLACSGCVTSAETVLITQQSHEELRKVLEANKVDCGQAATLHKLSVSPSTILRFRAARLALGGNTPMAVSLGAF